MFLLDMEECLYYTVIQEVPMRNVISVSLPDELVERIKAQSKKESMSASEIIRKALKSYYFHQDFTKARQQCLATLAERGEYLTDEDIFREVS